MKSRKHSKLKRNPFVRLIRGIFRLIRVLLKPKQRNIRVINDDRQQRLAAELARQQALAQQIELEHHERDRLITVGELFDRVKWQVPDVTILQEQVPDLSAVGRPYDVSRN